MVDVFMGRALLGAGLLMALATGASAQPIRLGFVNTFEPGIEYGWRTGNANNPTLQLGGPGGAGDTYLRLNSDGSGNSGKLTMFDNLNWWGDFITAGVSAVSVDLRNFDPQNRPLSIRLGFRVASSQGSGGWCTQAITLPADGQWRTFTFALTPENMTAVGTNLTWAQMMANVSEMRILHAPNPAVQGTNIVSSIGVDNVRAIPAPGAAALLGLGALAAGRRSRLKG